MKTRKQHEEKLMNARMKFMSKEEEDTIQEIWLDILEHLESIDNKLGKKK